MSSRLLLLCLVLLPLAGCGLMPARVSDDPGPASETKADLSAELQAAETALAETPQDSVLKEKVAALRKQVKSLESETLAKAEKLWAGQQPGAALHELDQALQNLPASSALQRRRTYYAELLERRLELPRAEQKLVRGRYVADSLRVERQIAKLAPGSNSATLAALELERKALAEEVQAIGNNALERRLFGFARWAFNIAGDLGAPDAAKRLAEVNQREKQKTRKTAPVEPEPELSEQQVLESRLAALKTQLEEALSKRDGLRARKVLTELQQLFPTEPSLGQYQQRLKPLVQEQANSLEAEGNRRYRDGDIAAALAAWKQALALAPDHKELPGQIARAEKVQANLNSLRNQNSR
ncbi:MAG: hypothetical protein ACK4E7_08555 [Permianibacter sp.]